MRKLEFKPTLQHPFKRVAYDESDTNKELLGIWFYCCMPHCDYKTRVQSFHKCPACGATYSCRVQKAPFDGRERKQILDKFRPLDGANYR